MPVKQITSKAQYDELVGSGKLIFVDFTAVWCGPCKQISPVFEQLAGQYGDAAEFYKLDVDEVADAAQEAGIRAMPTFHVYQGGNKVNELVGAAPEKLKALVVSGRQLVA